MLARLPDSLPGHLLQGIGLLPSTENLLLLGLLPRLLRLRRGLLRRGLLQGLIQGPLRGPGLGRGPPSFLLLRESSEEPPPDAASGIIPAAATDSDSPEGVPALGTGEGTSSPNTAEKSPGRSAAGPRTSSAKAGTAGVSIVVLLLCYKPIQAHEVCGRNKYVESSAPRLYIYTARGPRREHPKKNARNFQELFLKRRHYGACACLQKCFPRL